MKADAGGWGVLSADFADDADGKINLCNQRNLRISHSALRNPNSALERLFSGFHFGMDDWGIWRLNFHRVKNRMR
jgi:hypothetical protein